MAKKKKFKILNLRGCNASGKSWIVRELMKYSEAKPIFGEAEPGRLIGRVIGYKGSYEGTPIYFVGSYEVMSGGADHMMKHMNGLDSVCDYVRKFSTMGHVIFEGFIVSGLFSRFYELSKELNGIIWCYMDTPLDVCYKRIEQRNAQRTATSGRIRASVGVKHVEQKFTECKRTKQKFEDKGEEVFLINHHRPMYLIHKILRS